MYIKEGKCYTNSKGKKRLVVQIEYNIETKRTRIVYCRPYPSAPCKGCYLEQFIRWINS